MVIYNNIDLNSSNRRTDIAIANKKRNTEDRDLYNRQTVLNVLQPPADFQSFEEASKNASYQNSKAIDTLKTFMYGNDANVAFSDLLKNNQVNEFNQLSFEFKKIIGEKHISYLEFLSKWNNFISMIPKIIEYNKPTTLTTSEYEQALKYNRKVPNSYEFNNPYNQLENELNIKHRKEMHKNVLKEIKNKSINKPNTPHGKNPNGPITQIIRSSNYPPPTHNRPLQQYVTNQLPQLSSKEREEELKLLPDSELKNILNRPGYNIGRAKTRTGYEKAIIASEIRTKKIIEGHGFRKHRMKGSGINNEQSLLHRFNILSGEIQAGNDNQSIINEIIPLMEYLKSKKILISL